MLCKPSMLSKNGQRVTFCMKCGRKRRLASQPNRVRLCLPNLPSKSKKSLRFTERHGSQHSPAGMRAPAFIEPSCEALTDGSAHHSSHLIGARRLKERESVNFAFHLHLRKRAIHPSPRLPDKPILAKCEQRHFAQQPLQRERAWMTRLSKGAHSNAS